MRLDCMSRFTGVESDKSVGWSDGLAQSRWSGWLDIHYRTVKSYAEEMTPRRSVLRPR